MAKGNKLKDYEPRDRPLSRLNARGTFLSNFVAIAPAKAKDLFDCCYPYFLSLTRYKEEIRLDEEESTAAESCPLISVDTDGLQIQNIVEFNPDYDGLLELQNRYEDKRKFCKVLKEWAESCGIPEEWFLEFCWKVLLDYWIRTKPTGKTKKVQQIKSDAAASGDTWVRPNLILPINPNREHERNLPSVPPPQSNAETLGWLASYARRQIRTAQQAEKERQTTHAVLPAFLLPRISDPRDKQENIYQRNIPTTRRLSGWEEQSRASGGLITKWMWDYWRSSFKAKFDFKRQRASWQSVVMEIRSQIKYEMTAPEHRWENRYEPHRFGIFSGRSAEKPEYLRLKPPQPPEGLPSVTDWRFASQEVITLEHYKLRLSMDIRLNLSHGPIGFVPEGVRQKWVSRVLKECLPKINNYWKEYGDYLKSQGWVEVENKTVLDLHCEWLVRFVVLSLTYGQIAEIESQKENRTDGISEQAIGNAVREVADLVGVSWPERRGRDKSNLK